MNIKQNECYILYMMAIVQFWPNIINQLYYRYLQEIGYTDTIIDVRSNRVRSLLGLNNNTDSDDMNTPALNGNESSVKAKNNTRRTPGKKVEVNSIICVNSHCCPKLLFHQVSLYIKLIFTTQYILKIKVFIRCVVLHKLYFKFWQVYRHLFLLVLHLILNIIDFFFEIAATALFNSRSNDIRYRSSCYGKFRVLATNGHGHGRRRRRCRR